MDIVENEDPSDRRWREIMQRPRADDQGISVVDWWDVRLDAQDWFKAKDIRPDQAALLLFGHKVPNEVDLEQALAVARQVTIFDDGRKVSEVREGVYLSPDDFVHTFEVFSRFKREEPKARSLRAWLAIAESENLPHLSWVRAYITEKGWPLLEEPASVAAPTRKKWTPERLAALKAYRAAHGTEAAAKWAGISGARVRALLPGPKGNQPHPKTLRNHTPKGGS